MRWDKPIVLAMDGLWKRHIEATNADCLSSRLYQKWSCETDLRDFFDVSDDEDFVKSVEVWSSIYRAKNLAKFTESFQYEYVLPKLGGLRIRFPRSWGKWAEKKSYEEAPLLDPLYRLNFLRDSGFIVESLWAFRWDKSETCFAYADKYNVENLIAYNSNYAAGCKGRRMMGDYLWIGSKYRKDITNAENGVKEDLKKDDVVLKSDVYRIIYSIIERTPTKSIKRRKLRKLKRRREILKNRYEKHVWSVYKKTKDNFLDNLQDFKEDENESRIDFAYFNTIDSLLHLFRGRKLLQRLYSEAVDLYDIVDKIAVEQDRPLLIVSDHGMIMKGGAMTHSQKGMFSANYTFDELQENSILNPDNPNVEERFYLGIPKPQDIGRLLIAHLSYK
jgi:hypothetical protein